MYPEDLRYTSEHEWARREGEAVRVQARERLSFAPRPSPLAPFFRVDSGTYR